MRRFATVEILLLLLPFLLYGACALDYPPEVTENTGAVQQEIINGQTCGETENPSAVAILLEGLVDLPDREPPVTDKRIRTGFCTGTLIAPDVVLAAAHCQYGWLKTGTPGSVSDERFYISFMADLSYLASVGLDEPLASLPADAIEVAWWVHNPRFSTDLIPNLPPGLGNLYDIGLFFLSRPVTHVEPSFAITEEEATQIDESEPVTIVGWGSQAADPSTYDEPSEYRGQKICATSFINEVASYEMQVGDGGDSSRKCHGDSGGPTFMTVATDYERKERLVGITSHTYDESDCEKGAVDTRVDAWLSWVDREMRAACEAGDRLWCEYAGILPPDYVFAEDEEEDPEIDGGGCAIGAGGRSAPGGLIPILLLAASLGLRARRRGSARG